MPAAVVVIAALVVGVAFLVAGGTKLASQPSWFAQASGLGIGRAIATPVPYVEVVIGAGLVVQLGRRPLAVAAAALLVAFSVVLAKNLRDGNRPPCACFGALSAEPIGPRHLLRNAALFAVAVIAAL